MSNYVSEHSGLQIDNIIGIFHNKGLNTSVGIVNRDSSGNFTGISLKTINNQSLIGSGDITISGGVQSNWNQTTTTADDFIKNKPSIKAGTGIDSIIEGSSGNTASGDHSHAEGSGTTASGAYSHAQNCYTQATTLSQTAIGEYNELDPSGTATTYGDWAFIIGNGTSTSNRSNAMTVSWGGDVWASGDIDANGGIAVDGNIVTLGDVEDGSGNVLADKADETYVDAADANLQTQIDALGEPFRLQDFTEQINVIIPLVSEEIANTSISNVDIDLDIIDPTGKLNEDFAIASLAKYEVYDATSGGNRINCFPVCSFSMNSQRVLRVRMMCAGTARKTARRIQGALLLKHR